ncbi:MAG: hypothetical protein GY847_06155 [Proteobacteria bacterium]|nr:hypothetical protein [Pseudomonadota bacterium]
MIDKEDEMISPSTKDVYSEIKRDIAFYDSMVRERSPLTGIVMSPSASENKDNPKATARSKRMWFRVVAALVLLGVALGAIFQARINDEEPINTISQNVHIKEEQAIEEAVAKEPDEKISIEDVDVGSAKKPEPQAEKEQASALYDSLLAQSKKPAKKARRIKHLKEAIEINPQGDEALARLSIILMESAKTRTEALSLAQRSANINPDNAMAWLTIGYINQLNGRRKEALAAYKKCATSSGPKRYIRDCRSLI